MRDMTYIFKGFTELASQLFFHFRGKTPDKTENKKIAVFFIQLRHCANKSIKLIISSHGTRIGYNHFFPVAFKSLTEIIFIKSIRDNMELYRIELCRFL